MEAVVDREAQDHDECRYADEDDERPGHPAHLLLPAPAITGTRPAAAATVAAITR